MITVDVLLASMITGATHAINLTALEASERSKVTKHGPFYSPIGFSFLPFVASCFGSLGLTAILFLAALAHLELERHDQWLAAQGLDPLVDPSVRAQYRQLCIWKVGSCYVTCFITGGVLYHIFLLYNTLYAPVI
jgi:hypothetical protein